MTFKIAIAGAGPAGCMCACNLDKSFDITLFDKSSPLKTLLPTGGGKCNLAHAEYDFKELAKNYPRGEKFLYSAFSRFGTQDTIDFFENIGVQTYTREDNRVFPISESSKVVRNKILAKLHHCKFVNEEVNKIKKIDNGFELTTNKASYFFDFIIVSTGGKNGYKLLSNLGHNYETPCPSLVGLKTKENFKDLQGITIKNCTITSEKNKFYGNLLFTDNGITGPAVFELSSINARKNFPYKIKIDFLNKEINWQELFDKNPRKNLENLLCDEFPKTFVHIMLSKNNIYTTQKCCLIKSNTKVLVNKIFKEHEFEITGTRKDGEIVTCGGYNLNEFNPKTLESKIIPRIYACGEVLDFDGLCGGYNLQACWSTGKITAESINSFSQKWLNE